MAGDSSRSEAMDLPQLDSAQDYRVCREMTDEIGEVLGKSVEQTLD